MFKFDVRGFSDAITSGCTVRVVDGYMREYDARASATASKTERNKNRKRRMPARCSHQYAAVSVRLVVQDVERRRTSRIALRVRRLLLGVLLGLARRRGLLL
jgi:hypothetical protein